MVSQRHERKLGAGEANKADADKLEQALQSMFVLLQNYDEIYEEFDLIKSTINATLTSLRNVKSKRLARGAEIGDEVIAVSFSSFRQSHYERLGVEIIEPLLEQDQFISNVFAQLGHYGNLNLRLYNWSDLHKALARINDQVNRKAASRMSIDQWLLALIDVSLSAGTRLLLFPELRLSDSHQPACVLYSQYLTIITGTADYGMVAVADDEYDRVAGAFQEVDCLRIVRVINAAGRPFIILEAKNQDESLDTHVPQAIGQSLAVHSINGNDQVPFCLSNGREWIFGLMDCANPNPHAKRFCRRTEVITLTQDSDFVSKGAEILGSLFLWATYPISNIASALF